MWNKAYNQNNRKSSYKKHVENVEETNKKGIGVSTRNILDTKGTLAWCKMSMILKQL